MKISTALRRAIRKIGVGLGSAALICAAGTSALAQRVFVPHPRPVVPIRPFVPIPRGPNFPPFRFHVLTPPHFYSYRLGAGLGGAWWPSCGGFIFSSYGCGAFPINAPPLYYYVDGSQRPQLVMKDGTTWNVSDYWLVDNQLHFKAVQENGSIVERTVDFNQLDMEKTIDLNTQNGFRFVLRNEPMEQYLRDHPEVGTPGWQPPPLPKQQ